MNQIYLILSIFVLIIVSVNGQKSPFKIVNGKPVEPGAFPFIVSYGFLRSNSYQHICGGSIISHQHILTANHCLRKFTNNYDPVEYYKENNEVLAVIAGTNNLELTKDDYTRMYLVSKITKNLKQNKSSDPYDVAVLKLRETIEFNKRIQPVKLPVKRRPSSVFGKTGTVAGWGQTENGTRSLDLLSTQLTIINNMDIDNECKGLITQHYCAKDLTPTRSKPCFGDSGGPLFFKENYNWVVYGLVSFGITNGQTPCKNPFPTIFSMVPFNLKWILEQIK